MSEQPAPPGHRWAVLRTVVPAVGPAATGTQLNFPGVSCCGLALARAWQQAFSASFLT